MDTTLNQQIQAHMNKKNINELMEIWNKNDRSQWTEKAFEAVKNILEDRGVSVPDQPQRKMNDEARTNNEISYLRRFVNLILDILFFRLLALILLLPFARTDFIQFIAHRPWLDWVFGVCLLTLYYVAFEAVWQKTPAKFITGTKVIMKDGSKPGIGIVLKRTLSRFVPFEALSGKNGNFWHDRWTGTKIVNA